MAINDPTDIASLALWYDASDASTITEVSAEVSQWDDKSGNDDHLTQTNASFRPVVSSINGFDSIEFTGASGDVLDIEGPLALDHRNLSGYIVLTPTSTANNDDPLNLLNGTAIRVAIRQLGGGVDIVCFHQGNGGSVTLRNDDVLATNGTSFHIFRSRLSTDGDSDFLADDGTEDTDAGITTLFDSDIDTMGVGARPSGGFSWTGHVHEVGIFDAYLSDADRDDLNAYLEAKYFGVGADSDAEAFLATTDTDIDVDVSVGPDVEIDSTAEAFLAEADTDATVSDPLTVAGDAEAFLAEVVTDADVSDPETVDGAAEAFLAETDTDIETIDQTTVDSTAEAFLAETDTTVLISIDVDANPTPLLATTTTVVTVAPTQIELLDAWDSTNGNSISLPVSSGDDRLVVAGIYIEGIGVDDTPTAQYGDQDMTVTIVAETSGGSSSVIYHILEAGIAAATGTDVTISPSSGTSSLSVASYQNVNQDDPIVDTVADVQEPGETAAQDIDTELDGLIVAQAGSGSSTTHSWTAPLVEQTDQTASPTTASGSAADLVPTDGATVSVEHDSGLSNPNRTAVAAVSFRVSDNVATVTAGAEAFLAETDTDITAFPIVSGDAEAFLAETGTDIDVFTAVNSDAGAFLATVDTDIDALNFVSAEVSAFLAETVTSIDAGREFVEDLGGSGTSPQRSVQSDDMTAKIMALQERRKAIDEQELAETMPALLAFLSRIN